jgi:hypothetical protein
VVVQLVAVPVEQNQVEEERMQTEDQIQAAGALEETPLEQTGSEEHKDHKEDRWQVEGKKGNGRAVKRK